MVTFETDDWPSRGQLLKLLAPMFQTHALFIDMWSVSCQSWMSAPYNIKSRRHNPGEMSRLIMTTAGMPTARRSLLGLIDAYS